jgi:hypothetical protein
MSSLMKGTVTLADGSEVTWTAGPRERIKAERALNVKASDLQNGDVGEEYIVYLAYEGLKREGKVASDLTYDAFLDEHLGDYEVSANPESQTPPAQ